LTYDSVVVVAVITLDVLAMADIIENCMFLLWRHLEFYLVYCNPVDALSSLYQQKQQQQQLRSLSGSLLLVLLLYLYHHLHGIVPSYLADSLHCAANVDSRRHLRLANTMLLVISSYRRLSLGDRAFPTARASSINDQSLTVAADIPPTSQNFSL